MAEALGWAGMNRVPVGDLPLSENRSFYRSPDTARAGRLSFAINAGHGEFPRIVLASGDIEESFYDTIKAFNFADRYQMPVIHMLDKAIANSLITCRNLMLRRLQLIGALG